MDARITDAQHRIEDLYHETRGKCYVSFSGGKDSTVLLALIKSCQELGTVGDIPAVFSNTGIELGVTVDFIQWVKRNYYPNVKIIHPEKPFSWVLQNKGKPMKSKLKSQDMAQWQRNRTPILSNSIIHGIASSGVYYAKRKLADKDFHMLHDNFPIKVSDGCCEYMKKKPFEKYNKDNNMLGNLQGIRISEGGVRELAAMIRVSTGGKLCTWDKYGVTQKAPIIDWSDEDVEEFIKKYNVPLSEAYTKYGFNRTGCMCCPYSQHIVTDLEYLYFHEPNRYKASMFWLKDVYIAQNVILPFDAEYEHERETMWRDVYEPMRQEMLRKYRPESRLIKDTEQCKFIF